MNNENELIKNFNENLSNVKNKEIEPYKAVQNQNFNTINPINNTNTENNNSQNLIIPNYVNQQPSVNIVPEVMNENTDGNNADLPNNTPQVLYDTTNYISENDKPIETIKKKNTIKINPELKMIFFLALIMIVLMRFIPIIFDWFDDLRLKYF